MSTHLAWALMQRALMFSEGRRHPYAGHRRWVIYQMWLAEHGYAELWECIDGRYELTRLVRAR